MLLLGGDALLTQGQPGVTGVTARRLGELATDERDSLTGTRVLSAVVFHTGSVRIVLSDGRRITVRADEGNANWTLFSAEETLMLCTDGMVEVRA